jgi:hypothetical protein
MDQTQTSTRSENKEITRNAMKTTKSEIKERRDKIDSKDQRST